MLSLKGWNEPTQPNTTTMKTTKIRKGEYQITLGGRTLSLINDICFDTGKNQGWTLYDEQSEWMGCASTKKSLVRAMKQADEEKNYDF